MERTVAMYGMEPRYADRFVDVTNQREKVPFQVVAFTNLEALKEYAREHTTEILLISGTVPKELVKKISAGQAVVLADREVVPTLREYPSMYKYQSTDGIIREVLTHYCKQPKTAEYMTVGTKAKTLGVYSSIGRCLRTSFSWTLGQQLGENGKTLLVSMEEYSGFSRLMREEMQSDLTDVFYFYRQRDCSFARFSSMIYTWGNLDYVPSVRYPEDLGQITGEEMAEFLARIASKSSYEMLVVDMGNVGRRTIPMMDTCGAMYMPVKGDCVSAAKLEEFEACLGASRKRGLLEKIQRVKLPYRNGSGRKDTYLEQLVWGELGDYMRQFLKGKRWEGG